MPNATNAALPWTDNGRRSSVVGREEPAGARRGQTRRSFLSKLSLLGLGGGLFPGVLWAKYQEHRRIT
ncbi:MAG: twin-arginine translocation signal domain-containing protein, partial [Gemmatimonadota bacterium]